MRSALFDKIITPLVNHQRDMMMCLGRCIDISVEVEPDIFDQLFADVAAEYVTSPDQMFRMRNTLGRFRVHRHVEIVRRGR